jgi:hypothetical protein
MWLVSEVGELVEAYCETVMIDRLFPDNTIDVNNRDDVAAYGKLRWLISACCNVETDVARREGWTRNNQPKGTYDVPGECADIRMLLEKFLEKLELPESGECLKIKMKQKLRERGLI